LHIHQSVFLSEYTAIPDQAKGATPLGEPVVQEMATSFGAEPLVPKSPGAKPTQDGGAPGDEASRGEALKLVACGDFPTGRFFSREPLRETQNESR
jgi:hypothetical protein